jgi:polar amino acid transport system substrate-binding protein
MQRPSRHSPAVFVRTIGMALTIAAALALAASLGGCTGGITKATMTPKVKPPAIAKAGILRVALDDHYPPFGGIAKGQTVGLDVDVASALADDLGLKLQIVPTPASEISTAVAGHRADIGLGGLTLTQVDLGLSSVAGSYGSDGPVFFSSLFETVTVDGLGNRTVGAQRGSVAYWALTRDLGEGAVRPYPTLRDALAAMKAGEIQLVAGDAMVGAYIVRDMPHIRFAGRIGAAAPLVVTVAKDSPRLEETVRASLGRLSVAGAIDAFRAKWVGDLPALQSVVTTYARPGEMGTPTVP